MPRAGKNNNSGNWALRIIVLVIVHVFLWLTFPEYRDAWYFVYTNFNPGK